MHHLAIDEWSRRGGPLHRRDARAKIAALLVFLIVLATAQRNWAAVAGGLMLALAGAAAWARLPVGSLAARAAVVLPFSLAFAAVSALAGDPRRGAMLLAKSYVSALAVLLVVASTPLPVLLRALERLGAPPFLVTVAQFVYRYLFVLSEEAQHMRAAAAARGFRRMPFRAAAGALAALFARAHGRAAGIHQAMLARGFEGRFPAPAATRFGWRDAAFLAPAALLPAALRVALERMLP